MRMRIRRKDKTPQAGSRTAGIPHPGAAPNAHPASASNSHPGGASDAGGDGLPGTAGYRGGAKNMPPGGFFFQPPRPEQLKRSKKPWE